VKTEYLQALYKKIHITRSGQFTLCALDWNLQYPEGQKPGSMIHSTDRHELARYLLKPHGGLTIPRIKTL